MHDVSTTELDTRPADGGAPDHDQRYQTRMAWIASLWAAMAVLATAVAIWEGGHLSP